MNSRIQPGDSSRAQTGRERLGVLLVAGGIVSVIAVYLAMHAMTGARAGAHGLLRYQGLARRLPQAADRTSKMVREGLRAAEADRVRTSVWPDIARLESRGVAPFVSNESGYRWSRLQQGTIINYFGQPR